MDVGSANSIIVVPDASLYGSRAAQCLLLVVCFEGETLDLEVSATSAITSVKLSICQKWLKLYPSLFDVVGSIDNQPITSDFLLQSLVLYCSYNGTKFLKVNVSLKHSAYKLTHSGECTSTPSMCSGITSENLLPYVSTAKVDILTGKGQKFEGGSPDFRLKLLKHCLVNGYRVKLVKNDKRRVTAECVNKLTFGCQWRVHASRKHNLGEALVIKTMEMLHTCGAGLKDVHNPPMSSRLVKSVIVDMVRDNPALSPQDVINHFNREFDVILSYYFAYTGRRLAFKEIHGGEELSYHQLEWYTGQILATNPGSHVVLEKDPISRRFSRLFVSFGASIYGFSLCRPVVFLDATFLKGKFKGCLYAANGKNANNGIFQIAFAIVLTENNENWIWFMEQLKVVIGDERVYSFLSDRHPGLIASIPKVFPKSHHAYCWYHLDKNLLAKIRKDEPNRARMVELFKEMAYAKTHLEFAVLLNEFTSFGVTKANNFINRLPVKNWVSCHFQGNKYGDISSALAESYNAWILKDRDLPITALVDKIRMKVMKMFSDRRTTAVGWTTELCPFWEREVSKHIDASKGWLVTKAAENVFEVVSKRHHRVDLRNRSCSCNAWKIEGFPCAHAIRCIVSSHCNIYAYCDVFFFSDVFRESYSRAIEHVPSAGMPSEIVGDASVLPPNVAVPPGRPRKNRLGKRNSSNLVSTDCSHCGSYGHRKKKNCKSCNTVD